MKSASRPGLLSAYALLLFSLAACSVFREPQATPRPTTVTPVTADDVAQAMDQDRFYSTYGHTVLLISGTVAAIDPQPGHYTVTLATSVRTQVLCDLGGLTPALHVGDAITVRSADPENDVQRQDAAVLIQNCTLA